jgi:S-adenosyl methyltransferase
VDNDPVVASHARALLVTGAGLAVSQADLRDPAAVLAEPALHGVIDLAEPVCVILAAVAHFLPAAEAAEVTAEFTRRLAAGSWLAISVAHFTDEELLAKLYALHTTAPFRNHGTGQLAEFLAGLDLIPPGIAEVRRWLSGIAGTPACRAAYLICGVGAKP